MPVNPGLVTWIVVGALASAPTRVAAPDPAETETAAKKAPVDASAPTQPDATPPADATTPTTAAAPPIEDVESASTVEATPAPAPVAEVPPPRVDTPARRELEPPVMKRGAKVAYLVGGAVVLAGAGVALGFMGFFIGESKRIEREGKDRVGNTPSAVDASTLQDLVADGQRANRAAIGLGVGGALATSTAIALLLLGARKSKRPGVSASVGRGGAGLVWTRRF